MPSSGSYCSAPRPEGRAREEITIFESLGLAIEDLAAARRVYELAAKAGAGRWIDF